MALNLNKYIVAGNLGADPELKGTGDNTFCTARMATTRSWKKDGEWVERTSWVSLVANGYQAEKLSERLKGDNIYVEGPMEDRSYMKDGSEFWVKELKVMAIKNIPKAAPAPTKNDDDDMPW